MTILFVRVAKWFLLSAQKGHSPQQSWNYVVHEKCIETHFKLQYIHIYIYIYIYCIYIYKAAKKGSKLKRIIAMLLLGALTTVQNMYHTVQEHYITSHLRH